MDDARAPVPSTPYIIMPFDMLLTWCKLPASPGVWVDGVDGWELGERPTVFPVPALLAGPEDEEPFRFRLFCYTINRHAEVVNLTIY